MKMATISFDTALEKWLQEPEFKLKRQLIEARLKSKMTQAQIATKMNMKQANLARFEKSMDAKLSTIVKYAKALGLKELRIVL